MSVCRACKCYCLTCPVHSSLSLHFILFPVTNKDDDDDVIFVVVS